jgi:hypothetical protein
MPENVEMSLSDASFFPPCLMLYPLAAPRPRVSRAPADEPHCFW